MLAFWRQFTLRLPTGDSPRLNVEHESQIGDFDDVFSKTRTQTLQLRR